MGQFCKGLQELDEKAIAQCFENGDDLELSDLEDVDSDDAVTQKIMDFMKSLRRAAEVSGGRGHRGRRHRHGTRWSLPMSMPGA